MTKIINDTHLSISVGTKLEISQIKNFTRRVAVKNEGTTREEYYSDGNIELNEQIELIYKIYSSFHYVNHEGEKVYKLILGNSIHTIKKDYNHFLYAVKTVFPNAFIGDEFETIKLKELFNEIEIKELKMYKEVTSFFIDKSYLSVTDNDVTLYKAKRISDVVDNSNVSKEEKKDIIDRFNKHWRGHIGDVLDWLTAYRYAPDKKSARLVILAESNFGKSKLFEWLGEFGEATFLNMEDFKKGGINDKAPEEYYNKTALVLDEAMSFPRKLYDISNYMYIRPMREKARRVDINAIVLLSRDGGDFNSTHIDKQTANRITVIDFRKERTKDLRDVMTGYSKALVKSVLIEYLYNELKRRIEEYELIDSNIQRGEKAEEAIEKAFKNNNSNKVDLDNTKDFFEAFNDAVYQIIENPKESLSYDVYNNIWLDSTITTPKGTIIKRPATTIKKLVIDYDESLAFELKYKNINQLLSSLRSENKAHFIDGKTVRGALIENILKDAEGLF